MKSTWQRLGEPAPETLTDARLQLHHAAQIVASVGSSLLDPLPDDSHPNLGWQPGLGALVGHPTRDEKPFQAGLRLADHHLLLLEGQLTQVAELDLDGRTGEEATAWLASAIASFRGDATGPRLESPGYELPEHPTGRGARFTRSPQAAFEELGRWYANAASVLGALVQATPGAAPVRCWPHHFDLATLIQLDPTGGAETESARTIGVGVSPGDGSYAEPYWYVTPWPYPERPTLPELAAGGLWHTEGFLAAVLPASHLTRGDADAQLEQTESFLRSAMAASRAVLDR